MITICPQCKLSLAVTAADLRVAQGQVRCGRCAAVFNALASLREAPRLDDSGTIDAIPEEFRPQVDALRRAAQAAAPEPAEPEPVGPEPPAPAPTPSEPPATEAPAATVERPHDDDGQWRISPALLEAVKDGPAATAPQTADYRTDDDAARAFQLPRLPGGRLWLTAGSAALGLLLVLQVTYRHREALAGVPVLGSVLAGIERATGAGGAGEWDLRAYEVRQQGVISEPGSAGTLTLRASIRNLGERAQPAPLLRLTLLDRFGNRVATRDLRPGEYAGSATAARGGAMLQPGQRLDAEVAVLDPGGGTVGFEIDTCLARPDGTTSCAGDLPPAPAS